VFFKVDLDVPLRASLSQSASIFSKSDVKTHFDIVNMAKATDFVPSIKLLNFWAKDERIGELRRLYTVMHARQLPVTTTFLDRMLSEFDSTVNIFDIYLFHKKFEVFPSDRGFSSLLIRASHESSKIDIMGLYADMRKLGIVPNEAAIGFILQRLSLVAQQQAFQAGTSQVPALSSFQQVFADSASITRGAYQRSRNYTIAIRLYAILDDVPAAHALWLDAKAKHVKIDSHLYAAILMVYSRTGDVPKILELQQEMEQSGLEPADGTEDAAFIQSMRLRGFHNGKDSKRVTALVRKVLEASTPVHEALANALMEIMSERRIDDMHTAFRLLNTSGRLADAHVTFSVLKTLVRLSGRARDFAACSKYFDAAIASIDPCNQFALLRSKKKLADRENGEKNADDTDRKGKAEKLSQSENVLKVNNVTILYILYAECDSFRQKGCVSLYTNTSEPYTRMPVGKR
jgi:hypothetical protein